MSRIDRIRQTVSAREAARKAEARADAARQAAGANLPVPVDRWSAPAASARTGPRRLRTHGPGDRPGRPAPRPARRPAVLQTAADAYNRTEWSGSFDRRARKGRGARTDV
jgi:hypothetical protein